MCIVMPQIIPDGPSVNMYSPFQYSYLGQSLVCFLNITFICACGAIMCIPQHNYQTMTTYFSLIYHSKCVHYHADWSIILCNTKPIFK